VIDIDPVKLA